MFKVLKSPTSRTTCAVCHKQIMKGTPRVTANLGSGNYPHHFHTICFYTTYKKQLKAIMIENETFVFR